MRKDALTAESVHHAIAGVAGRAAATLDALARGDGSVPELDFLTSPRHGLTLGHRVAFAVPANVGRQPGWSAFLRRADRSRYAHPYDLIGRQAVATRGAQLRIAGPSTSQLPAAGLN